jgi:DhnA family fructose-bisphosphate aldolase class Ia
MRAARWGAVVAASLAVSACAGTAGRQALLPSQDLDTDKIELVNRWAHDRGATIIWVNYPTRPHPRPTSGD